MKFIFIITILCFLIQQIYHWVIFSSFAFKKSKSLKTMENKEPISLVICGKNEENNLHNLFTELRKLTYPKLELVFVDDHSTDNTFQTLMELQKSHPNLSIVDKSKVKNRKGKKEALFAGVSAAKHERIVVMDADCFPTHGDWISHYAQAFDEGYDLVLGLSPNTKKTGFWKGFFRYETYFTAVQYASYTLLKMPYMGVGRNMGYTKEFFLQHFPTILEGELSSGDDDLLVNLGANGKNTTILLHQHAITLSDSPMSLKQWFRQKTRHLTAGVEYRLSHKILLSFFPFTLALFFLGCVVLCFTPALFIAILLLLWHFFTISVIHGSGLRRFHCADLIFEAPVYLFLWCAFIPIISIYSTFNKPKHWS